MRHEANASDIKNRLADYVRMVEDGDEVLITRYGKPVAALVAPDRLRSANPGDGLAGLVGKWTDGCELANAVDDMEQPHERPPPSFED